MPFYEYRCASCANEFEMRRSYAEADASAPCPACQSLATRRKLSLFACVSKSSDGASRSFGGGGGCAGCQGGNCASCGH